VRVRHTKFVAAIYGLTILAVTALVGKFTGELGLYVSGIVGAYTAGNSYITGKALANGKEPNGAEL
jgi:hypothetical protein